MHANTKIEMDAGLLNSKWLNVNVDIGYKQLINCTENIEVRHLG